MQLEAHADAFIRDINAFVEAHVLAIDRYLSGHLDRNEERPLAALAPGPNAPEPGPAGIRFEGKQAVLHRLAERRAGLAMQPRRRATKAPGKDCAQMRASQAIGPLCVPAARAPARRRCCTATSGRPWPPAGPCW